MSTVTKKRPKPSESITTGPAAVYALREVMCKWPIGEPGEAGFHFCCKRKKEGSPYCEEHALEALRT